MNSEAKQIETLLNLVRGARAFCKENWISGRELNFES